MSAKRIIDITQALKEPMRGFSTGVAKSIEKDGWNASTLEIYSHAGTHMDAPLHFDVNEKGIDEYAPERFICPCHIVRLVPAKPKMLIQLDHIAHLLDGFQVGQGIIFHTGWSKYVKDPSVYRDQLPRISTELAEWMVRAGVNIVGVEPPSIADVNNIEELQEVHRILLEGDVIIIEGLCRLEEVEQDFVQLVALPLKVRGGDGAPVRALVIEN